MTPLDVVSLDEAKSFLKVDFDDEDNLITSLIYSAVSLVEQYTQYRLYNRDEIMHSDGTYDVDIMLTPLVSVVIKNLDGVTQTVGIQKVNPVRTTVCFGRWNYHNITISYGAASLPLYNIVCNVGYADTNDIPIPLITAVKEVISEAYENRISGKIELPSNIQMQLNPFVRNPLF